MEGPTWWGVEVGPWSEWVAALLTGGSLLLGFYILLRDRRKEERQQANRLSYWQENGRVGGGGDLYAEQYKLTVHLKNESDRQFTSVQVLAIPLQGRRLRWLLKDEILDHVYAKLLEGAKKGHPIASMWFNTEFNLRVLPLDNLERSLNEWENPTLLRPGSTSSVTILSGLPLWSYNLKLDYIDAANVHWERDIKNGSLRRSDYPWWRRLSDKAAAIQARGWPYF